jgi:hypothetical protein
MARATYLTKIFNTREVSSATDRSLRGDFFGMYLVQHAQNTHDAGDILCDDPVCSTSYWVHASPLSMSEAT